MIQNAKFEFDSRGEKTLRNELRAYLSRELDNKTNNVFKDLKFTDSKKSTLIQLADMVAGSIYSSFTLKDTEYLKTLKTSNRIEDIWEF